MTGVLRLGGGGGGGLKSNTSVMEEKFKEADTKVKEMDTGLTGLNEQVEQLQKKIKYIKDSKKKELNSFETTLCYSVQPKRKAAFLFFMFIFLFVLESLRGRPRTETTLKLFALIHREGTSLALMILQTILSFKEFNVFKAKPNKA